MWPAGPQRAAALDPSSPSLAWACWSCASRDRDAVAQHFLNEAWKLIDAPVQLVPRQRDSDDVEALCNVGHRASCQEAPDVPAFLGGQPADEDDDVVVAAVVSFAAGAGSEQQDALNPPRQSFRDGTPVGAQM